MKTPIIPPEEEKTSVVLLQGVLQSPTSSPEWRESEQPGQDHQQQAVPVDAQMVAGADGRNPVGLFDELKILALVEAGDQREAN
jgi:hypothetical protein